MGAMAKSKQAIAKEDQGYSTNKPIQCFRCKHFTSDVIRGHWGPVEKNMRCSVGGFKVMKTARCNGFSPKVTDDA